MGVAWACGLPPMLLQGCGGAAVHPRMCLTGKGYIWQLNALVSVCCVSHHGPDALMPCVVTPVNHVPVRSRGVPLRSGSCETPPTAQSMSALFRWSCCACRAAAPTPS